MRILIAAALACTALYTMNNAAGSYLRSAKLDGSGATGLSEATASSSSSSP